MSMKEKDNIFSGLEDLGFSDIHDIRVFPKKEEVKETQKEKKEEDPKSLLYDATFTCPVCQNAISARTVKSSAIRRQKSDSDLFTRYSSVNPYFYEVILCNVCGYAAMRHDFDKIREYQVQLIQQKISPKWQGRRYPEVYDVNIAIERFKLALLNSVVMESKASRKAIICLRLAWMYRLLEDDQNEKLFLKQAVEGFNEAYSTEDFPISGMDKFTAMYLIGELHRRTDNLDEANSWFSKIITTPNTPQKIKDMARDQRDVIKEQLNNMENPETESDNDTKKSGFFSKFFK